MLRVRHSITNTNYYVQVFAPQHFDPTVKTTKPEQARMHPLRKAVKKKDGPRTALGAHSRLPGIPMTGLTRKVLQRLHVMESAHMALLE